jgi:gluconate 2-dehydrogenase gamma chain
LRRSYRQGIAAVNQSSRILYGSAFAELAAARQVDLLTLMEQGRAPAEAWKQIASSDFFDLLVEQTMQGFYGDPRHGGNREGTSWKMLGVPYPPIRGRLHFDVGKQ